MVKKHLETREQLSIASYIKKYHKNIIFHTTRVESKKDFWEQNQIKKLNSHSGFPDTFILHPVGNFAGLMIEQKKLGTKLFNKSGYFATEHLQNQYITHMALIKAGYAVYFTIGVHEAIETIESYLKGLNKPFLDAPIKPFTIETKANDFFTKHNL